MRPTLSTLALGLGTLLGIATLPACTPEDTAADCVVAGVSHPDGSTFAAPDGCNSCQCSNGTAACTAMGCVQTCTVEGLTHVIGVAFPSADGCNTCVCSIDGTVACTTRACLDHCDYQGVQHTVGESFAALDGCNTCTCLGDGSVSCTKTECHVTCGYDGSRFEVGDQFPATDGCNDCTCMDDGSVACTEKACLQTCSYDNQTWQIGDTFPSDDGCNTCSCLAGGFLACTDKACVCDPATEWWRDYALLSSESCAAADLACPDHTTPFQNACGCGCEQAAECAKEIDCFDASCDPVTERATCPYSTIDTMPDCTAEMPCKQFSCKSPGQSMGCGMCHNPPEETTCADDAACGDGSICEPLTCACQGQKVCVPACTADTVCPEGQACGASGRCEAIACDAATCPANFSCESGHCQRRACSASSTCDDGGFCVNAQCFAETGNCYPPVP